MSIKRRTGSSWQKTGSVKRFNGTAWETVSTSCRRTDGQWRNIWLPSGNFTSTYELTDYASYRISTGERITDVPMYNGAPVLMQGSPDEKLSTIISTLMFFPTDRIRNDLHDATLNSAVLRFKCVDTASHSSPAYALIHYGNAFSACPETWDGTDKGDADSTSPSVTYSRNGSYSLNLSVIRGLLDGKTTFLALNAASRPEDMFFFSADPASVTLTLTYSR